MYITKYVTIYTFLLNETRVNFQKIIGGYYEVLLTNRPRGGNLTFVARIFGEEISN